MNFSINECKAILRTLPIGYYCGRKVPVEMSETAETSFYSPAEDKITISYPIINKGLKKVNEETNKETAVRSMLYHELSHVILTPDNLISQYDSEMNHRVLNAFEDERIETLLNSYYMDVNFKQQIFNIMGGKPKVDTKNPFSVFFALVRYRYGEPKLLEEVNKIIKKFQHINRASDWYGTREALGVQYYREAIFRLWNKVNKSVKDNIKEENLTQDTETLNDLTANVDKKNAKGNGGEPQEDEGEETAATMIIDKDGKSANVRDIAKAAMSIMNESNLNNNQIIQLAAARKAIERLIENFNKKNSGGTGYNAYNGVFNPRAVVRDDYKYFDRRATINGNNQYGTSHLNLVIDCSGSFVDNEPIVNALLGVLSDIERKTPDFSMDVSFINTFMRTAQKISERVIKCDRGNLIPDDWQKRMTALQKKNSYNYNIVLFDGDALSNCYQEDKKNKLFKQLDMANTTLITDKENRRYMENNNKFTRAKVIITNKYTDELINNVVRAFQRMFN